MADWKNETEAREQIKSLVADYYNDFKRPELAKPFCPGDRLSYASRVYDEKEMCSLVDAALDFWLTTGRFSDEFEREFAKWIGVKYANLVNSGSSANLVAFMATGYFDMVAYEKFHNGEMVDYIPTDEELQRSFAKLPQVD